MLHVRHSFINIIGGLLVNIAYQLWCVANITRRVLVNIAYQLCCVPSSVCLGIFVWYFLVTHRLVAQLRSSRAKTSVVYQSRAPLHVRSR